jgi:hypothetical protein
MLPSSASASLDFARHGSERQRDVQTTRAVAAIILVSAVVIFSATVAFRSKFASSELSRTSAIRGQDLLQTSQDGDLSQRISSDVQFTELTAMDEIFAGPDAKPPFLPETVEKINNGHMKCCARAGADIPPPAYTGGYGDWPKIICIPGYRLDSTLPAGQNCILCEAGSYCPTRDANIYSCPQNLWSSPGSSALADCWCAPGYFGPPNLQVCRLPSS